MFCHLRVNYDSGKTESDVERLNGTSITLVGEFHRPKSPQEPRFCVENGCDSVLESVDGRRERVEVKSNDSGSK